jgi:hypothetical protein
MWWRWFRWVLVGLFVVSWIPSAANTRLAWVWMGTWAVIVLIFGVVELAAPRTFLNWRRTYLAAAPQWEQRLAYSAGRMVPPRVATIRVIGATLAALGAAMLVVAARVWRG